MPNINTTFIKLVSVFIVIAGSILVSCDNYEQPRTETIPDIPTRDTLYLGAVHNLPDTTLLFNPLSMLNVNDQYLVINEVLDNNFVKVFSIPDFSIAYSWGEKGRGPGEFMMFPPDLGPAEDGLFLFGPMSQSVKTFSVTDSSLEIIDEQDLNYEGQVTPLNRVRRINKDLYFTDYGGDYAISPGDENDEHIALQPDNKTPLFTFGTYPESDLKGFNKSGKYSKTNWVKPDGMLFVTAYFSASNRVKIYTTDGQLQQDITVINPDSASYEDEDNYLFRAVKWASDDYIYFLGYYNSEENIYNPEPGSAHTTYLEIWDWEGNPLARYSFDRIIRNFTVSEQLGKIYAHDRLSEDKLFEYDLPDLDEFD